MADYNDFAIDLHIRHVYAALSLAAMLSFAFCFSTSQSLYKSSLALLVVDLPQIEQCALFFAFNSPIGLLISLSLVCGVSQSLHINIAYALDFVYS